VLVYETLANLDVKDKTVITLFNKQDARMDSEPLHDFKADHTLQISAKNGTGLEELKNLLSELLRENKILVERTVPYANIISFLLFLSSRINYICHFYNFA